SFDTRSSSSIWSSRSPVYFVYRYFIHVGSAFRRTSVVILLLPLRDRRNRPLVIPELVFTRPAHRRLGGVIPALVAAADLLQRVQSLEHEVDARCEQLRRRLLRHAGGMRQPDQSLHVARVREDFLAAHRIAQLQAAAKVEPLDDLTCL